MLRQAIMRSMATSGLFALAVGYALAHFFVLFYNHWYFAGHFWLKTGLLTPLIAIVFFAALYTTWRVLWIILGVYWIATHLIAWVPAGGPDLRGMEFVAVLDLEAAVIWLPTAVVWAYGAWRMYVHERERRAKRRVVERELALRRKIRLRRGIQDGGTTEPTAVAQEGE